MKFKRFIYIWDIHWNKSFIDFVNEKDDWKTKFILMWDIFDRWNYSYEVFEKIKEFHKDWKLELVLWNHDLFLIFWTLFHKHHMIYENQLRINWWKNTLDSFKKNIVYKQWLNKWYARKYQIDTANYLLENFNLYHIDELWNLSIHWWIPYFENWFEIWYDFWNWIFLKWLEMIKEFNKKIKEKDEEILWLFTWIQNPNYILRINSILQWITYNEIHWNDSTQFTPTWFLNREYELNENIKYWLIKTLKDNWLNRFFCWHDWFNVNENNINKDSIINRLDWRIWYYIVNNKNEFIEWWIFYPDNIKNKVAS